MISFPRRVRAGLLLLVLLVGAGCIASTPPVFKLLVDDAAVDGYQAAYCWRSTCVDGVPPQYGAADYIMLPAGAPIRLNLETPLPDALNLALRAEPFGTDLASTQLSPAEREVSWEAGLDPGRYVLVASAKWSNGDALYFFAVEIAAAAP